MRVFVLVAFFFFSFNLWAQKFELVDEETYVNYYKKPIFVPDVRINGEYQFYQLSYQDATENSNNTWQDFHLNLTSEVQENVHLFLNITNTPYEWGGQNTYQVYDRNARTRNNENIRINVKEFYLEYNSNPNAIFRVGRQKIDLGNKRGLIYQGEVDAFRITCRVGTWCWDVGQANLDTQNSKVTWFHFFYPVYESAESIDTYWMKRKKNALFVDFYRIDDKQNKLALAKYGGRTYSPIDNEYSPDQIQHNREYVFYDRNFKTYGINITWHKNNSSLELINIQGIGSRDYYLENNTTLPTDKNNINNKAYLLEWQYLFTESRIGFRILTTSGAKQKQNYLPWQDDSSYYEWNRGSYQDSLIYFGSNGRGNQHSVSNIISAGFYYDLYEEKNNIEISTRIYNFSFREAILSQKNNLVKNIGTELNLLIAKKIVDNFLFQFDAGYFYVGSAYSPSSALLPTETQENITQYSLGLNYKF